MAIVLSIIPYKVYPARSGGQKNITLFNEYFSKEARLIAVTVRSNDPAYAKGYTLLNILSDAPFRYVNPWHLITFSRLIRKYKATHLMLEHPYLGWLGILLNILTGVKLIVHSQNIEATRWRSLGKWWWKILWYYERMTHRRANYNFFIQDDDRRFAVQHYQLKASTCLTIPYGLEIAEPPSQQVRNQCKARIKKLHGIAETDAILLFNGALDYKPNYEAVTTILDDINPLLINSGIAYKIIICGKGLPPAFNHLKDYENKNIIYTGFVEDITVYYQGSDVLLNPITSGGGIKTKLVEALGYNMNAVSVKTGAIGVDPKWCNGKLLVCEDGDWPRFAALIQQAIEVHSTIPPGYFEIFYWGHLAEKAVAFINVPG